MLEFLEKYNQSTPNLTVLGKNINVNFSYLLFLLYLGIEKETRLS